MCLKKYFTHKWLLFTLILLVISCIVFIIFKFIFITPNKIPKIQDQPTDTRVAKEILQLHHWQTINGTNVYFVPTEAPPMVDIMLLFNAGAARDQTLPGLAKLTADLMYAGTATLDAAAIVDHFNQLGAQYDYQHTWDYTGLHLRSLAESKKLYPAIDLFTNIITNANFPPAAIQRHQQQLLTALAIENNDADAVAYKHFLHAIYPQHPYANSLLGTEESLKLITNQDIKNFYDTFYVANNLNIVIVGSIHRDSAKKISELLIKNIKLGAAANHLPEVAALPNSIEKQFNFPSKQAHLYLGQPSRIAGDIDYFPLELGNHILGAPFTGRLFQEIREQHGLAYICKSAFIGRQQLGPFFINLQTSGSQITAALALSKQILIDFVKNGPTELELIAAKKYLTGAFPLRFTSNQEILQAIAMLAIYNLPYDFFDTYVSKIEKVTTEQIKAAFNKKLDPAHMAQIIVGGND